MSKTLSLTFASVTVLFMSLTAISISHSGWLVLLFSVLSLLSMAAGFVTKALLNKKQRPSRDAR